MDALEYVKRFKMDQPNYSFDRNAFVEAFGKEFRDSIHILEQRLLAEDHVIPYTTFKQLVNGHQEKFNKISELKLGKPLSKGLWNAFYALHVIPLRGTLYPQLDKKIQERKAKTIGNNPSHPKYEAYKDYKNTESQDKILG